ncbi:hypothetical protein BDD12DRAFT_839996 [Trichophaea hybrida]|nr:hypothetical protein BDD12DRAFT_839996 [Trichophaea hybrida]
MPRNKGKKQASAPTPPKPYTTRVHIPAWVLEKEKKDRKEEEARIVARDSHPAPTTPSSSSSSDAKTVSDRPTQGLRRLQFGEREYDSDCGSEFSGPEQSDNNHNDYDNYEDDGLEGLATDALAQIQIVREEFEISLFSVKTEILAKIDIIPIKFEELRAINHKTVNSMEMKFNSP